MLMPPSLPSLLVALLLTAIGPSSAAEKSARGGSVSRWRTHMENAQKAQGNQKHAEALGHMRAALAEAEGFDDRNAWRRLESLDALALMYLDGRLVARAELLVQRREELRLKHYPKDDVRKAAGMYLKGLLLAQRGDFTGAEVLMKDFEALVSTRAGVFSSQMAICQARLADAYLANEKFAEAETLYKKAAKTFSTPQTTVEWGARFSGTPELVTRSVPPEYENAVTVWSRLVKLYTLQSRDEEAGKAMEEMIIAFEKSVGRGDARVGEMLSDFAALQQKKGDWPRAEAVYVRALKAMEKAYGRNDPRLLEVLKPLIELGVAAGREESLAPQVERQLQLTEKALGPGHLDVAAALFRLGTIQLKRGKEGEAEKNLGRALAIEEQARGRGHPALLPLLQELAGIYTRRKQDAELEPVLRKQTEALEQLLGAKHIGLAGLLETQAAVLRRLGRAAEADAASARAAGIREASPAK